MISWKTWLFGIAVAQNAWRARADEDAPEHQAGGQYLIGTGIYDM
jgi:hypothetical protein